MTTFRIGHGYDIHRLASGRKLILGGVNIEFGLGLDGHSDADVIIHALMDSLLGAACLKDIGHLFPNTDPSYKGANSMDLLQRVKRLVQERGYSIANIDITVIAEKPKLSPYMDTMRANISRALEIPSDDISIKATTNENTGLIGKGEGIAAFSAALLYK